MPSEQTNMHTFSVISFFISIARRLINEKKNSLAKISISWYFFLVGLVIGTYVSRLPEIKDSNGLSDLYLGLIIFFSTFIGVLVCTFFPTFVNNRVGSACSSLIGSLLMISFLPMAGILCKNVVVLILSFVIFLGFGMAWGDVSINAQGSALEKKTGQSLMGKFYGMCAIGNVAGALVGGAVTGALPPLVHFSFISAGCFPLCFIFYFGLISKVEELALITNSRSSSVISTTVTDMSLHMSVVNINENLSSKQQQKQQFARWNKTLILLCILGFLFQLGVGCMMDWCTIFLTDIFHVSPLISSTGYAAYSAFLGFGQFVCDHLVDKVGGKKVLWCAGLLTCIGFILLVASPSLPFGILVAFLALAIIGLGTSAGLPVIISMGSRLDDVRPSNAIAALVSSTYVAYLIAPAVIGGLSGAFHSLRWALCILVVTSVAIIPILFFVVEPLPLPVPSKLPKIIFHKKVSNKVVPERLV